MSICQIEMEKDLEKEVGIQANLKVEEDKVIVKMNKKKRLFGHKRFYELTRQEEELHSKKNRDYANSEGGDDPLRNFRSVGLIAKKLVTPGNEDVKIAIIYLLKQLDAAINLLSENREGGVEGIAERLGDVGVYAKLARILYEEGKMRK